MQKDLLQNNFIQLIQMIPSDLYHRVQSEASEGKDYAIILRTIFRMMSQSKREEANILTTYIFERKDIVSDEMRKTAQALTRISDTIQALTRMSETILSMSEIFPHYESHCKPHCEHPLLVKKDWLPDYATIWLDGQKIIIQLFEMFEEMLDMLKQKIKIH